MAHGSSPPPPGRRTSEVIVCGIRHHGPGSARSVLAVLERVRPAAVVIEGPPELDDLVVWADDPDLRPPVAALIYRPDRPSTSSFYPMATFSPEWNALRWARTHDVPVAFADLAAAHTLADRYMTERDQSEGGLDGEDPSPLDPIGQLAAAAGYDDAERWWEDAVEHRHDPADGFEAILDAIAVMRADHVDDAHMLRREAAMRKVLRRTVKATDGPVVVVCGAYHAPALLPDWWPTQKDDTARLRGLSRQKVVATWVPWTAGRLALASGYGAGVASPGWYDHCFTTPDAQRTTTWMVGVARALREVDLPAPTASAVEAARLADALAALRGRPHAGLTECSDAVLAVLCGGRSEPLDVIVDRVVVGHAIGDVPDSVPQVPLAKDLDARARTARLRRTAEAKEIVCDLRQPAGLAKSVLLHRLGLLDIPWGRPSDAGGTTGTFKEAWTVRWQPELAVRVIEAATYGQTVEAAATDRTIEMARAAEGLVDVVGLLDHTLPADLPAATAVLVEEVDRRAATSHDTVTLMAATEPLARVCRYGDVRRLDTTRLRDVLDSLIRRIAAALGPAVSGLDEDAAAVARAGIDAVIGAVRLLDHPVLSGLWLDALGRLVDAPRVHPGITGRAVRLLLDQGRLSEEDAAGRLSRALSPAVPARQAAAWADGFLDGDVSLLLLDPTLLALVDGWMTGLTEDAFDDLLPLVRRTFARHTPVERNQLGQRLRHGHRAGRRAVDWRPDRARPAVEHVLAILGAGSGGGR